MAELLRLEPRQLEAQLPDQGAGLITILSHDDGHALRRIDVVRVAAPDRQVCKQPSVRPTGPP